MAREVKFSLAMPTRNMASHIGAAVGSVLSQEDADVELLVQDACSTDGTSEVLGAAGDDRVKIARERDDGQADAINRGFRRASGEILGWLNADDELTPRALTRVASVFEHEPETLLVYGRGAYMDGMGNRLRDYDVRPFDRRLLLTRDYILQPAAFWRRSLWDRVGALDPTLTWGFDWDWFIRASLETPFRLMNADLAMYRLTGENKSVAGGAARQAELAQIARRHGGRLQPTYLYWRYTMLKARVPFVAPLEPMIWRLFAGRIMA